MLRAVDGLRRFPRNWILDAWAPIPTRCSERKYMRAGLAPLVPLSFGLSRECRVRRGEIVKVQRVCADGIDAEPVGYRFGIVPAPLMNEVGRFHFRCDGLAP